MLEENSFLKGTATHRHSDSVSEKQEILHFESLNAHLSLNCRHIHGQSPHSATCHNVAPSRGDNLARKHPEAGRRSLKFVNELGVPFFVKSSHQTRLVTCSEARFFWSLHLIFKFVACNTQQNRICSNFLRFACNKFA